MFDLYSEITGRIPKKPYIRAIAPLYQKSIIKIKVYNPYNLDADFKITTISRDEEAIIFNIEKEKAKNEKERLK